MPQEKTEEYGYRIPSLILYFMIHSDVSFNISTKYHSTKARDYSLKCWGKTRQ